MRNFMLISKMHTFVFLFCRFFELWPVLGRKRPVLGKTGIFGLWMAITQNPTEYLDLQVFREYILIVRMDLSQFPWFKAKILCKMALIQLIPSYFHTFSIGKRL